MRLTQRGRGGGGHGAVGAVHAGLSRTQRVRCGPTLLPARHRHGLVKIKFKFKERQDGQGGTMIAPAGRTAALPLTWCGAPRPQGATGPA